MPVGVNERNRRLAAKFEIYGTGIDCIGVRWLYQYIDMVMLGRDHQRMM